jgi:uncharacterized protein (TIGR00369 family)
MGWDKGRLESGGATAKMAGRRRGGKRRGGDPPDDRVGVAPSSPLRSRRLDRGPRMPDAPSSPLADAVRRLLNSQGFMRLVGAHVEAVEPGRVTLSLDRRDELLQQHGLFHGGVIAFLVDNATGAAASTMLRGEHQSVLTAEYKLNFLAPGEGARLSCVAEVVKPGRRLSVVEARVHAHVGDKTKLVAVALASIAVLDLAEVGG